MHKRLLFSLLLTLSIGFSSVEASHVLGGELFWNCAPSANGQYIFTLVVYYDCNGPSPATSNQFINGPNGSISCSYIASLSKPLNHTCSTSSCAVFKAVYKSLPISLSGVPPSGGWEFSWSNCCKYQFENAPGNNGIYLRSKMYPYQAPGSASPQDASICYDNAPAFGQDAEMVFYDGVYEFNHQAMDLDQDSLIVELADVYTSANTPASFSAGYSAQNPFPDSTENPLNGPVQMDPYSGTLRIETYGAPAGYYQNAVVAKSYRNNQLIAEVFRDLPSRVDTTATLNSKPLIWIDTAQYSSLQRNGSTYRIAARNNDTLNFNILTQDMDMNPNGTFQTFCVTAQGTKINSANPSIDSLCPAGGSCATFSPVPSGAYCGTVSETFNFNWVAQCQMLNSGLLGRTSYVFYFRASDQACPHSKHGILTLIVDLYPTQTAGPSLSITGGNTNGQVDLAWSPTQAQASSPFDYYIVYGNSGPGTAFTAIDSVGNRQQLNLSLNNQAFPAEYYVRQVAGSCVIPSSPGDTVNSNILLGLADREIFPFELYPQPSRGLLNIKADAAADRIQRAIIYDLKGAPLERYELKASPQSWTLKLHQEPGLYLLVLEGETQVYQKRILIQ